MNIEFELLSSILRHKNVKSVYNFSDKELKIVDIKEKFNFIRNYYKKYNEVPSINTIEKEFSESFEVIDKLEIPKYYADKILENNNRQKFLILSKKVAEMTANGDDLEKVYKVFTHNIRKIKISDEDIITDNIGRNAIERMKRYEDKKYAIMSGYDWGFKNKSESSLDTETPLVGGRLYLVQARPGIGKTFLCCATAAALAKKKIKTLFISKEMSTDEVLERADAFVSGISYSRLKKGMLSDIEKEGYRKYLELIENQEYLEVKHPRRCTQETIKGFIEDEQPNVVFIDYLQLLKDSEKGSDRRTQMENIIYDLKEYSQQFNIPIICISATNREGAKQEGAPNLENIAASDSIGYAIDALYSLYQKDEDEVVNRMNLVCIKNRHGKKFTINLLWDIDNSVIRENSDELWK